MIAWDPPSSKVSREGANANLILPDVGINRHSEIQCQSSADTKSTSLTHFDAELDLVRSLDQKYHSPTKGCHKETRHL